MKKISAKQRSRDCRIAYLHRNQKPTPTTQEGEDTAVNSQWLQINNWIDNHRFVGLNALIDKRCNVTLKLPVVMNFSDHHETTALHIEAIRRLSGSRKTKRKAYRLVLVDFDNLRDISTSAALVLTAELSKWDDVIRQRLRPLVDGWDTSVLQRFTELGFFDLFQNNPLQDVSQLTNQSSDTSLVKYIKGECGDNAKTRQLKENIRHIVGEGIDKWIFLNTGLTEAITNVTQHAYPESQGSDEKNWYLSGGFNRKTKELKIVFYDQGVGIPKSLPASEVWERVLEHLSVFPLAERKKDEVLLRGAVELDRTSTKATDRGKGLQDMLEFVKQRRNGYLSILSRRGLYRFSMTDGESQVKSEHFENPILGTLIIWKATLDS